MFPVIFAGTMCGQVFSNASLSGKYFLRNVQFTVDNNNNATDSRSISGSITFDGNGNYAFTGTQVIGKGAGASYSSNGTYSMQPSGILTLTNPQTASLTVNARYGAEMVIGSSTEASTNTYDLFVAIPAPASSVNETNAALSVAFVFADWELQNDTTSQVTNALGVAQFDGAGNISINGKVLGHGAAIAGGNSQQQTGYTGTYTVNNDGTGVLQFQNPGLSPGTALLGTSNRSLYVSSTGNVFLGANPGAHDILIGLHDAATDNITVASFTGRYWVAGFETDTGGPSNDEVGSATVITTDSAVVITQREHDSEFGQVDLTSASYYTSVTKNTGVLIGAGSAVLTLGNNNTLIGADIGETLGNQPTGLGSFNIVVAERIPSETGAGVFVNPQGVVNAASNAPAGEPISPGEFIAIYGSGLAGSTVTATPPYTNNVGGVSVSIGGLPAPIYYVSSTLIDCLVPYGISTTGAVPVVVTNGTASNTVNVPVAATAPGVFSNDYSGAGEGAITHNATGALVSSTNPAVAGEVLVAYLTGLGALQTPVTDGHAPSSGGADSAVIASQVQVQVDGVTSPTIYYAGINPVYPGLYQIDFQMPVVPDHGQDVNVLIVAGTAATEEVLLFAQ